MVFSGSTRPAPFQPPIAGIFRFFLSYSRFFLPVFSGKGIIACIQVSGFISAPEFSPFIPLSTGKLRGDPAAVCRCEPERIGSLPVWNMPGSLLKRAIFTNTFIISTGYK